MTQLFQTIYAITPYLFIIVLMAATFFGIWLIAQLKKSTENHRFIVEDNMLLKRNAARVRKMEYH